LLEVVEAVKVLVVVVEVVLGVIELLVMGLLLYEAVLYRFQVLDLKILQ
tara:strand:+ start:811 stop:957 length:147 start_codon:yes stop_codon:yes gene_type:complete